MSSLPEALRAIQRAILDDTAIPEGVLAPGSRPAIYRHAYGARLEGALRANYPALAAAMGDDAFRGLAERYARLHPSRRYSIRWHGERLAELLDDDRLADLARMDWALGMAFDAPDAPPFDVASLARLPLDAWDEMPLDWHPSLRVLRLQWSVEPHWQALRGGAKPAAREPEWNPHALLVWRMRLDAHWRTADADEADALEALRGGATLALVARRGDEERARRLGEWFAGWVRDGLLVARPRPGA